MSDIAKHAGVSRQAVYLHFANRADLLIEATLYLDDLQGTECRLELSRAAPTGRGRLQAYIEAWGSYIPEIYGVAKAFMAMRENDDEARKAWDSRMQDVREGCEAAIIALDRDGDLRDGYSIKEATDLLWILLSVRNWEQLIQQCGWSQKDYLTHMHETAQRLFVKEKA